MIKEGEMSREVELGIALGLNTPITDITGYLEDIDFVQFMGIAQIGYQGEAFDERVLDRIREFHNAHPEVIISVDGGVNFDTAHLLAQAGAKRLVSGSAILKSANPAQAIAHLKKLALGYAE
jgi:ribulose-phosphate 3-epimerase